VAAVNLIGFIKWKCTKFATNAIFSLLTKV